MGGRVGQLPKKSSPTGRSGKKIKQSKPCKRNVEQIKKILAQPDAEKKFLLRKITQPHLKNIMVQSLTNLALCIQLTTLMSFGMLSSSPAKEI